MASVETEWRFLRGWSKREIEDRLQSLSSRNLSFRSMDSIPWRKQQFEKEVGMEAPGVPEAAGAFERIKQAVILYEFSDPRIVRGYFDREAPLLGRRMLLELQSMGFGFLCGTMVSEVLERRKEQETVFGYRYDTLEGHLESGMEWFIVRKDHATGKVLFRIEAHWRPGHFPNLWSRVGFILLARRYQKLWHRQAQKRLMAKGLGRASPRLSRAIVAGAVTGMRSFSALSRMTHRRHDRLERIFSGLAVLEVIADKLPFIPNRTNPAPLLARAVLGALTAALATRDKKFAPVGALVAVASAVGAYQLRKALSRRLGNRDRSVALAEDLLVLRLRSAL